MVGESVESTAAEAARGEAGAQPIRVLLATDGSEASRDAVAFVALLPLPAGSQVDVLTVLDARAWQVPESLKGAEQEWANRVLQEAGAPLLREGVTINYIVRRGQPARDIVEAARELRADLVVVGSHGHTGLERFLLGSVAEQVARHAPCSVLIGRKPVHGLRSAVLALDGSEHAERAVRMTAHFPLPEETEVIVCTVILPYFPPVGPEYAPDMLQITSELRKEERAAAERLVALAARDIEQARKRVGTTVREGDPASEILALAEDVEADLIIAGARGVSAIEALLLGSVADRLMRHAPCSVLLVR